MSSESVRLPHSVVPVHYDLKISINLKELAFSGEVDMKLKVKESTKIIQVHCVDLKYSNVWSTVGSSTDKVIPTNLKLDEKMQTLVVTFSEALPVGEASLHVEFSAPLSNQMRGLYRSKYSSSDGEERFLAVTQFESNSARRAFPCFDEPALKATFTITLNVPKDRVTLSNMPEASKVDDPTDSSRCSITFEKSPIMSTYLVAIVCGEYDYVENDLDNGVKVRVFVPVGAKSQGTFALDVASRALPYYADYFQIPYPLPKLDLITVPDFSAGAMENWGLVTYREILLLADENNSSLQTKQRIAEVIAHEIAHQWFGNIVTMEWWTHLWLNEGYANFTENLCVDSLFPEYEIWKQFMSGSFNPALRLDSLKNTHPIEVPVATPEEVDEIFDEISYDKGASVIRMLHKYLGDADFRKGMNVYLNRHKYGNTFTEDLWAALEESSGKPVGAVMSGWTKQPGYPVVTVDYTESDSGILLKFTQTRFLLSGEKDEENTMWKVPIDVSCSMDDKVHSVLMEGESCELTIPKFQGESDWIKVNSGACGFFRTRYDSKLLKRLIPAIQKKLIPEVDRINILNDLKSLVHAGYSPTVELLEMVQAYKGETDYCVLLQVAGVLSALKSIMSHRSELKDKMGPILSYVISPVYRELGWEPKKTDSHLDLMLRPVILSLMGENRDEDVIKKSREYFEKHLDGIRNIDADFRPCIYRTIMLNGGLKEHEALIKLYDEATSQEEKVRLSRSLGFTENEELIRKVIEFAMKKTRLQDLPFVLYSACMSSPVGGKIVWEYFKENYSVFVEKYSTSDLMIRLVKIVSRNFATRKDADEIQLFFKNIKPQVGERGVAQNIESILIDAAWMERDADSILKYLQSWKPT